MDQAIGAIRKRGSLVEDQRVEMTTTDFRGAI